MTQTPEDHSTTAQVVNLKLHRRATGREMAHPTPAPRATTGWKRFGHGASRIGITVKAGLLRTLGFTAYVILHMLRGIIRTILGCIGGASLIGFFFYCFYQPDDPALKTKVLIALGIVAFVCTSLRVAYDKILYALTPGGILID